MNRDWMNDKTDKWLADLEARLAKACHAAAVEVRERADRYFADFVQLDIAMRNRVLAGRMTDAEYKSWRYQQVMTGKRWVELQNRLAADYTRFTLNSADTINAHLAHVFAENFNWQEFLAEYTVGFQGSFTVYNRDAIRLLLANGSDYLAWSNPNSVTVQRWNAQQIYSAVVQGILQGDSISHIADRLQSVERMNRTSAIRTARTLTTGAENGGRFAASRRMASQGLKQRKVWAATLDHRTRDSHRDLDGEERDMDEEFSNGLMYPGEEVGDPAEYMNCRCRYITLFKGFSSSDYLSVRSTSAIGDDYNRWKRGHAYDG